jgi:uncharacterized protein (TIGR02145 family)
MKYHSVNNDDNEERTYRKVFNRAIYNSIPDTTALSSYDEVVINNYADDMAELFFRSSYDFKSDGVLIMNSPLLKKTTTFKYLVNESQLLIETEDAIKTTYIFSKVTSNSFRLNLLETELFYHYVKAGSSVSEPLNNTPQSTKIGNNVWSTSNLNTSTFKNGDLIFEAKSREDWEQANEGKKPAWCYYNFDSANGTKYAKLYNWFAVNDSRGLAPEGWHIATSDEWEELIDTVDGGNKGGYQLKTSTGWGGDYNGNNAYNFSARPGGRCASDGSFDYKGFYTYFWTANQDGPYEHYALVYSLSEEHVIKMFKQLKKYGFSVRLVKN